MKTIKLFAAALLMGAVSFSCSSDDDENTLGGDLTAKWNRDKTIVRISGESFDQPYEHQAGCSKDYVEFTESNFVNNVIYFDPPGTATCEADSEDPQAFTRTDNTLVIGGGEFGGTYEIRKLTNSELEITQTSTAGGITTETTVYFDKASN